MRILPPFPPHRALRIVIGHWSGFRAGDFEPRVRKQAPSTKHQAPTPLFFDLRGRCRYMPCFGEGGGKGGSTAWSGWDVPEGPRCSVGFHCGGSLVAVSDRDRLAGRDRFVIGWRARAAQPSAEWAIHRWRPRASADARQSRGKPRSKTIWPISRSLGDHSTNSELADCIGPCVGGNWTAELPAGVYQLRRSFGLPSVTRRHLSCGIDRPASRSPIPDPASCTLPISRKNMGNRSPSHCYSRSSHRNR